MIPTSELNGLHTDAATAVNLALAGEVGDGVSVLLAGLQRTEALQGREPWAEELVRCYRKAVAGFCRQYEVNVEVLPHPQGLSALSEAGLAHSPTP